MSLNGLDAQPVQEAYQTALNEAGGWSVYPSSRKRCPRSPQHHCELQGTVAAVRFDHIPPAQDPHQVYPGRYFTLATRYVRIRTSSRRRRFLTCTIARTAVHFQDVLERYSPYETLLEITVADGLNDTALAASFPLHTASPATSTHRLHEISEDAEDGSGGILKLATGPVNNTGAIFGTQRYKMERRVDQLMRADRPATSVSLSSENRARSPPPSAPLKPSVSQFLVREDSGQRSITSLSSMPSISDSVTTAVSDGYTQRSAETIIANNNDSPKSPSQMFQPKIPSPPIPARSNDRPQAQHSHDWSTVTAEPSGSTVTSRSDEYDPYDFSKFDIKPKVKLGPRPVVAGETSRLTNTASIASIPAGFKQIAAKKETARPKSQGPNTLPGPSSDVFPAPPPIPDVPEYNPRPVSRGSVKSLPSHKSGAMTPDKIRLMKAVELRKRQMRKSNPQQGRFVPPNEAELHQMPQVLRQPGAIPQKASDTELEKREALSVVSGPVAIEKLNSPTKKPDSGIEMDYDLRGDRSTEKLESSLWPTNATQTAAVSVLSTNHQVSPPEPSTSASLYPAAFEPTMSPDMLESLPVTSQHEASRDTPTLEKLSNPLDGSDSRDADLPNVPTIVMADGSRPMSTASGNETSNNHERLQMANKHAQPPSSDSEISQSPKRKGSDLAKRRRGMVQPLEIDTAGEIDSDDEFYEELGSATFQEATPVTVTTRTPVKQAFERKPSLTSLTSAPSIHSIKSINITNRLSTPVSDKTIEPSEPTQPKYIPGPLVEEASNESTPVDERSDALARRNVSSGISKRIQALSEVSNREMTQPSHIAEVRPLSPMVNEMQQPGDRMSSFRNQPRSRTSSYRRQSKRISGNTVTGDLPLNSVQSSPAVWNVQSDPATNRSSISVTARIVRPTHAVDMAHVSQADGGPLQQSEIVINQKRMSAAPKFDARLPRIDTETSPSLPRSDSAADMAPSPVESTNTPRSRSSTNQSLNRRSIIGRHRHQPSLGPSPDDFPPPPKHMITSGTSFMNWGDENAAPKEGSRTSRFFKRMSGFGVSKRKSMIQPSNADPSLDNLNFGRSTPSIAAQDRDMPPAVVVGVLNVQFPDTLLWKRRNVEIDNAGSIIFTSPHGLDIAKGLAKRYALAEFQLPYLPDLDSQELPYSVMLDFVDGSTLQVACEDTMAHRQVLQLLRTHWKAWNGA
nr:hypothetical protein CFP56_62171 [Quercus suber]